MENQGGHECRGKRCRSGRVTQFKPGRGDHLLTAGFGFRADKPTFQPATPNTCTSISSRREENTCFTYRFVRQLIHKLLRIGNTASRTLSGAGTNPRFLALGLMLNQLFPILSLIVPAKTHTRGNRETWKRFGNDLGSVYIYSLYVYDNTGESWRLSETVRSVSRFPCFPCTGEVTAPAVS